MGGAGFWAVAGAVVAGLGLGCFHLLGRRLPGWARAVRFGHGSLGIVGACLSALAVWPGGGAWMSLAFLGLAVIAGIMAAIARWRGRRPAGLLVALHAVLGMGGFLVLLGAR